VRITVRRTLGWASTGLATIVGFYFVVLPCLVWLEGAYNQSQGGWTYAGWVLFDIAAAAAAPMVARRVWRRQRASGAAPEAAFRASCWWGGLVGVPVLILFVLASAPFF
jgi:hypothetical protein